MEVDVEQQEEVEKVAVSSVRVASIQTSSVFGDVEGNIRKLLVLVEEAATNGAKFVVLPETSIMGYLSQDLKFNWCVPGYPLDRSYFFSRDPSEVAEEVVSSKTPSTKKSESTVLFGALAKKYAIYITLPIIEKAYTDDHKTIFYNTVLLVGPSGDVVTHYRKNNPWPIPEKSWATAGTDLATYDTEYGKVGIAICYDIHTILGRYANENIWCLLYPIAWVGDEYKWYRMILPSRLQKLNLPYYIVGANWTVDETNFPFDGCGLSTIYSPGGNILISSNKRTGTDILYADLPTSTTLLKQPTNLPSAPFNHTLYNQLFTPPHLKHL